VGTLCYIKGRRKRRRPPKKWTDNIKEDVKLVEISSGEVVNLTRDRDKRRSLVATSLMHPLMQLPSFIGYIILFVSESTLQSSSIPITSLAVTA